MCNIIILFEAVEKIKDTVSSLTLVRLEGDKGWFFESVTGEVIYRNYLRIISLDIRSFVLTDIIVDCSVKVLDRLDEEEVIRPLASTATTIPSPTAPPPPRYNVLLPSQQPGASPPTMSMSGHGNQQMSQPQQQQVYQSALPYSARQGSYAHPSQTFQQQQQSTAYQQKPTHHHPYQLQPTQQHPRTFAQPRATAGYNQPVVPTAYQQPMSSHTTIVPPATNGSGLSAAPGPFTSNLSANAPPFNYTGVVRPSQQQDITSSHTLPISRATGSLPPAPPTLPPSSIAHVANTASPPSITAPPSLLLSSSQGGGLYGPMAARPPSPYNQLSTPVYMLPFNQRMQR